jgi:hypothetical protein
MKLRDFFCELRRRRGSAARAGRTWPGTLRWFSAEFLVVVTGVVVALALNAWWHERQDRKREVLYLQQLSVDLVATEAELAAAQEFFMERALASARVTQAFWQPSPPSPDSLVASLSRPLSSFRHRPVLGTIHALVATGDLRLIRSDALRSELIAYLEFAQASVDDIQRHDETYYRTGVNEMRRSLDPAILAHLTELHAPPSPSRRYELSPIPAGERRPPFPGGFDGLYENAAVYEAYSNLLVAHRNQAFNYLRILDRARRVHGAVHEHLHGTPDPGSCQLEAAEDSYVGACGAAFAGLGALSLRLHDAGEVSSGAWAREWKPYRVWTGTASLPGIGEMPIEVEVDIIGRGVARTGLGWYPVRSLVLRSELQPGLGAGRLSFLLDGGGEVEPNGLDAEILVRARELLGSERDWDRADDRRCTVDATTFSLYCALHRASLEVAGGFHHRRPALQRVRALVEQRSAGREYAHRLQDYNNDPTTSLADIHSLIHQALVVAPAVATNSQQP